MTLIFAMVATPIAAHAEAEALPPEVSLDGLEQVEKTRHKEIYRAPDVDWSSYDTIIIDEATVAFRKNWQRDQNRNQPSKIRAKDMDRIRTTMAEVFDDVFTKELAEKGGYAISEQVGESTLRITPYIVDLDVYAPDPRYATGIQQSYVETAGRMTLKLHLHDSETGDLIGVFSDHREAPRRGYMQWANSVSNTKEFRLMLKGWARELREGLQAAQAN
jgi:hypothetical protein